MAMVQCSRCGNTAEGLERPPLPGPAGEQVHAETCRACWQDWLSMQVKVINEYRISPAEPEQYDFLVAQMRTYLNLADER